jgi:hypothetical protein
VELDASQLLTAVPDPAYPSDVLGGLYQLRLPAASFSIPGIYTLLLRPKSYQVTIMDCGVLSGLALKGLVLDATQLSPLVSDALVAGGLRGYRIEYLDVNGARQPDYFTIVTWSARATPISQSSGANTQSAVAYQFSETGNLLFLTVTPSGAPAAQPNQLPFIGVSGGQIMLTPPGFDAETIELEIGENDFETLALGLFGDQSLNNDTGVLTTFRRLPDGRHQPFRQTAVYEVEDEAQRPRYVVKQLLDTPDLSENWDSITANLTTLPGKTPQP